MHKTHRIISLLLCGLLLLMSFASCDVFNTGGETQQKSTLAETVFEATLTEPLKENEALLSGDPG